MRRVQKILVAVIAAGLVAFGARAGTYASFNALSAESQSISSNTLVAPTSLAATCVALVANISLSWVQTSSAFATGYQVLRSTTSGGPYTLIGTVSGLTSVTYTDTSPSHLQIEYYVVQAVDGSWVSSNSNQASVGALC